MQKETLESTLAKCLPVSFPTLVSYLLMQLKPQYLSPHSQLQVTAYRNSDNGKAWSQQDIIKMNTHQNISDLPVMICFFFHQHFIQRRKLAVLLSTPTNLITNTKINFNQNCRYIIKYSKEVYNAILPLSLICNNEKRKWKKFHFLPPIFKLTGDTSVLSSNFNSLYLIQIYLN